MSPFSAQASRAGRETRPTASLTPKTADLEFPPNLLTMANGVEKTTLPNLMGKNKNLRLGFRGTMNLQVECMDGMEGHERARVLGG